MQAFPDRLIKQIGGWKTTSVFHRYAIVNHQDMAAAMRQYEDHKYSVSRKCRTKREEQPAQETRVGHNRRFPAFRYPSEENPVKLLNPLLAISWLVPGGLLATDSLGLFLTERA